MRWPVRSLAGRRPEDSTLLLVTVLTVAAIVAPTVAGKTNTPAVTGEFGVFLGERPTSSMIATFTERIGAAPESVMWYESWAAAADFPAEVARTVAAAGALPVITWEPWDPAAGSEQPAYSLAQVATGAHDAYITGWARQAARYGLPVRLRFAHEMNGTWYPWSAGVNGNEAADYVAAWRHVHDVFARNGASNVSWMWSPSVPFAGSSEMAALYPGDGYVDTVALDGYNWGSTHQGTTWESAEQVFAAGVTELRTITAKPLHLGEVASAEAGGSKDTWVADAFAWLRSSPEVAGFTWFNQAKEAAWQVDSSPGSLRAFRSGVAAYR